VFGAQTGPEAANSAQVFRLNYNDMTESGWRFSSPLIYYEDRRPLERNWGSYAPRMSGGRFQVDAVAAWLWQTNLLANRLIELPLAYLLAEGVSLSVPNEEAQQRLNAFWHDPINKLAIKLPRKVREMALFGEQCWPAFTDPQSGHVRLGYLDPSLIETVVTDPDNAEQPIGIVVEQGDAAAHGLDQVLLRRRARDVPEFDARGFRLIREDNLLGGGRAEQDRKN